VVLTTVSMVFYLRRGPDYCQHGLLPSVRSWVLLEHGCLLPSARS